MNTRLKAGKVEEVLKALRQIGPVALEHMSKQSVRQQLSERLGWPVPVVTIYRLSRKVIEEYRNPKSDRDYRELTWLVMQLAEIKEPPPLKEMLDHVNKLVVAQDVGEIFTANDIRYVWLKERGQYYPESLLDDKVEETPFETMVAKVRALESRIAALEAKQ